MAQSPEALLENDEVGTGQICLRPPQRASFDWWTRVRGAKHLHFEEWLDVPENRPNETHYRKAIWIPHFRGWKSFLAEVFDHAHIVGVGGPGAPHLFRLERIGDAGIPRTSVDDHFWRRKSYRPHRDDVILRTKRWLSNSSFSQKVFLYLPAERARGFEGDSPPVFEEKPHNPNSEEANSFRKYAKLMRQYPFEMNEAADELERYADGTQHLPASGCILGAAICRTQSRPSSTACS